MYMFLNALILALLVPASAEHRASDGPACHAQLDGVELTTTLEMPTGLVIEGPWRIVHRDDTRTGQNRHIMFAELQFLIQEDELTGERKVLPFPQPVRLVFEGSSQKDLVRHAARTWCTTVLRSQYRGGQGDARTGSNTILITLSPAETARHIG